MEFNNINKEFQEYRKKKTIWGCVLPISFVLMFNLIISRAWGWLFSVALIAFVLSICMLAIYSSKCSKIDNVYV